VSIPSFLSLSLLCFKVSRARALSRVRLLSLSISSPPPQTLVHTHTHAHSRHQSHMTTHAQNMLTCSLARAHTQYIHKFLRITILLHFFFLCERTRASRNLEGKLVGHDDRDKNQFRLFHVTPVCLSRSQRGFLSNSSRSRFFFGFLPPTPISVYTQVVHKTPSKSQTESKTVFVSFFRENLRTQIF